MTLAEFAMICGTAVGIAATEHPGVTLTGMRCESINQEGAYRISLAVKRGRVRLGNHRIYLTDFLAASRTPVEGIAADIAEMYKEFEVY